jgi:hypothetical protein
MLYTRARDRKKEENEMLIIAIENSTISIATIFFTFLLILNIFIRPCGQNLGGLRNIDK